MLPEDDVLIVVVVFETTQRSTRTRPKNNPTFEEASSLPQIVQPMRRTAPRGQSWLFRPNDVPARPPPYWRSVWFRKTQFETVVWLVAATEVWPRLAVCST